MTTLVDAAVKPDVGRYVANIARRRLDGFTGDRPIPFYVMKSNGGVLSADEVVHQPITTVLSGPAAGALGAALIAQVGRLRPGAHLRRRRHLDRRLGRHRRRADADHRGHGRRLPEQDPDDRRRHRRRRRRLDRLALARGHAQGRPAVGRRRPRPALLRQGRHRGRPSPTPTSCSAGSRRTCSAARSRSTSTRPAPASRRSPASSASTPRRCATGILEISAWNQANALRQVTVKRGLDVRDFTLTTFGGSGLAAAVPADRHPRPRRRAGAAEPGQRVGVRPAHRRREERLRADPRRPPRRARRRRPCRRSYDDLTGRAADGARARGLRRASSTCSCAPPTCATSARPSRCGSPCPTGAVDAGRRSTRSPHAFHAEHRALYGYDFRDDPRQQVEWVNLRVTGIGPITRPETARARPAARRRRRSTGRSARAPVCFDATHGYVDTAGLLARRPARRRHRRRPGDHRGVRLDGAAAPRLHRRGSTSSAT